MLAYLVCCCVNCNRRIICGCSHYFKDPITVDGRPSHANRETNDEPAAFWAMLDNPIKPALDPASGASSFHSLSSNVRSPMSARNGSSELSPNASWILLPSSRFKMLWELIGVSRFQSTRVPVSHIDPLFCSYSTSTLHSERHAHQFVLRVEYLGGVGCDRHNSVCSVRRGHPPLLFQRIYRRQWCFDH